MGVLNELEKEFQSSSSFFFLETLTDKRGLHLIAWENICKPIARGGAWNHSSYNSEESIYA